MLYKTHDGWRLPERTVIYTQNGQTIEQPVGEEGIEWWQQFADKWEHTEIIEFTELHYTDEQLARLGEVQNIGEGYTAECESYVIDGTIPDAEPFKIIRLEKEKAELQGVLDDLIQVLVDKGVAW